MSEGVKNVIVIIYNLYNLVCWKIFYIWIKSVLGNYETTLYSYFLSGDIDWYGYRWTDVHCFSIVDCRWHYSIGDVTFIMDQEEENEWDMILKKEKREAIEAGRRALNSLQAAKENLNSAKNWGLVDMFGGGFFTTMLKHSRMDQAKRNMEQAKYDLRNFSRELNDVNMACNLNIDTGDFLSFADYFFDGFVVDWVVQDRINHAKRQVEEAIRRTESIVNQLQRM